MTQDLKQIPAFQISDEVVGGVRVIRPLGKILLNDGDQELSRCVKNALAEGCKNFVLNLAEVPYIDSAGLGVIINSHTKAKRQHGKLVLCSCVTRVKDMLGITKLITVFNVCHTEQEALASFQSALLSTPVEGAFY